MACRAIMPNFIDGDKHYSQGSWESRKPETLFPWRGSGRIICKVLGRQEIQNFIGGDKIRKPDTLLPGEEPLRLFTGLDACGLLS